jgi:hypothetical protein
LRFAVPACLCCLGNTYLQPSNLLPYAGPADAFPVRQHAGERRISLRRGGTVICFLSYHDGSASSLARIDQTDVGVSSALPLALAFSVLPKLRPLTRLAVRSVRVRNRTGLAVFPCSVMFTGWFRSALIHRQSSCSRRATSERPNRLRAFWPKPVSLFGLFRFTMLASIYLVLTMPSDSSAPPS